MQHECTGAIKNITRDECNSVYLAAEKEPATPRCVLHWSFVSFGHHRSSNQSRQSGERWKKKNGEEANRGVYQLLLVGKSTPHLCSNHFHTDKKQWSFKMNRGGLVQCLELWMLGKDLGCGKEKRGL